MLTVSAGSVAVPIQVRLSPDEPPLVPEPNGPGAGCRLIGAPAERVLHTLSQGGKVELLPADKPSVEVTRKDFAPAHRAFEKCVQNFQSPRPR